MSKNTIYFDVQDSLASNEINEYDIEKIQYVRWRDSNSKNYNTHIIRHDLESLANNTTYTSFSSGYYYLPQILEFVGGGADVGNAKNDFAACLKNSVLTVLNQVLVKLNDIQLTDNSQWACMYENWELLHLSTNDLKNMKDLINFAPDSATSAFTSANSPNAPNGYEFNNVIKEALFDPVAGLEGNVRNMVNTGRLDRMMMTSFNPAGVLSYYIEGDSSNVQKSYTTGAADTRKYYIYTYIPLGFLHPIFKKLPVMRGMKLNLQVGVINNYEVTLAHDGTNFTNATSVSNSSVGNGICPFQISPVKQGFDMTTGVKLKLTINEFEQVHLILPQITFTPDFEAKYNNDPVKKISYLDYNIYSPSALTNVSSMGIINQERIVNSVVRPRELIIIPQYEQSLGLPFSSAPLTTCPFAKLNNFNVQINGNNIWQESHLYDYQSYLEMIGALTIDGRQYRHFGVSNGLISKQDWDRNYTYYYVNLNNAANSPDDRLGKQISVSFQNISKKNIRYYCIVTRERQILCDVSIGKVKEVTMEDDSIDIPSSIE